MRLLIFTSLLFCSPLLLAQNTVAVALNYNFNGIVHAGEAGSPDAPNGFRSISDRALNFTGGVPNNPLLASYNLVSSAGVLDTVHLGNRSTVANGSWAFESSANGNNIGTQPTWLTSVDQSGLQVTVLAASIDIGLNSSASVLFHVSNGGGSFDVTFIYSSGLSSVHSISAADWFGGPFPGCDSVDTGNNGAGLNLTEAVIDLSGYAGESMVAMTFGNRSNLGAGYGIYAVNVEPEAASDVVNNIPLQYNWNGIVHAGEAQLPDQLNGYRSISDRGLDFTAGVPSQPLLDSYALVATPGVADLVMLGNRNTVASGSLAFDAAADGDDIGVQPSWLPQVDLTGPQTTILAQPILLDGGSRADVLFQTTQGGGIFDVTFTFATGSVTALMLGSDWVGGAFPGRDSVDSAQPGLPLRIENESVDLSPLSGSILTAITFSNFSNPNGSCAILAVNVSGCLSCGNAGSVNNLGGGDGPTIQTTSTGALGCVIDWTTYGLTPNSPLAFWTVGLGITPSPLSLIIPSCTSTLFVPSPLTLPAVVDATGSSTLELSPATDPAICGTVVTAQFVELIGATCPLILSDALAITIGN